MAGINNFLLSWWYSPTTKLAINFQTTGGTINPIGGLTSANGLSSSLEENYHYENLITNHPVEGLTSITDNIIRQPKTFSITGLLTAMTSIPLVGNVGPTLLNFNTLARATSTLSNMADSGQLLTLTTGLLFGEGIFRVNSVAIQSLDIMRDPTYGRTSIKFRIVFKQVIITDTTATSRAQVNTKSVSGSLDPSVVGVI